MSTHFNSPTPINYGYKRENIQHIINYILSSGKIQVYCNYPEQIPSNALGDYDSGNVYLNKVNVNGDTELFASYRNMAGKSIYFGVQLYNPNSTSVLVTVKNRAFHFSGDLPAHDWNWVVGQTPVDFLKYTSINTITVNGGSANWPYYDLGLIPNGSLFNVYLRFMTNGPLWCFPYVYANRSKINGTATLYPWSANSAVYRGYGSSYEVNASFTINVSQMPYVFGSNSCIFNSSKDMIPINDQGSIWSCSNANLGNWGAHYKFTVTITNDTASSKTINAYVETDTKNLTPVIKFGNTAYWINLTTDKCWNWLTEDSLAANASKTYNYEYIQAAQSNSPSIHSWTAA